MRTKPKALDLIGIFVMIAALTFVSLPIGEVQVLPPCTPQPDGSCATLLILILVQCPSPISVALGSARAACASDARERGVVAAFAFLFGIGLLFRRRLPWGNPPKAVASNEAVG